MEKKLIKKSDESKDYYQTFRRNLAFGIVRYLANTPITPNQITIITTIIYFIAAGFYAFGAYIFLIIATIFKFIADVLDCVDGGLYRYRLIIKNQPLKENPLGIYFDSVSAILFFPIIIFGVSYGVYRITQDPFFFILGFISLINFTWTELLISSKRELEMKFNIKKEENNDRDKKDKTNFLKKIHFYYLQISVTLFNTFLFFFAIINRLDIFLWITAIVPIPTILARIIYDYKLFKDYKNNA